MTKGWFVSLLLVFWVGVCLFGISFAFQGNPDHEYVGKSVFTTEEDYIAFKEFVAQDDIDLTDATVLSSAPPIVVQYTYAAPAGLTQYGDEGNALNNLAFKLLWSLGLIAAGSSVLTGFLLLFLPD